MERTTTADVRRVAVEIAADRPGTTVVMQVPSHPRGVIIIGDGPALRSPHDDAVSTALHESSFATFTLAPENGHAPHEHPASAAAIARISRRFLAVADWAARQDEFSALPVGYLGTGPDAAAAIAAAAERRERVHAVVAGGGRPDLVGRTLERLSVPALLIVGAHDADAVAGNQEAMSRMRTIVELEVIAGASDDFTEPGALAHVARLARRWFTRFLG
jgi:putative phosphoribosyl transferase